MQSHIKQFTAARPLPDLAATEALGAQIAAGLAPGDAVALGGDWWATAWKVTPARLVPPGDLRGFPGKVVAAAPRRTVILVGNEKLVKWLGARGSLPVEVVPFAEAFAVRQISALGLKPRVRTNGDGSYFFSDNGNLILDCALGHIRNPARLDRQLTEIPGVVDTGLFIGVADLVLVAYPNGKIKTLKRRAR